MDAIVALTSHTLTLIGTSGARWLSGEHRDGFLRFSETADRGLRCHGILRNWRVIVWAGELITDTSRVVVNILVR